MTSVNLLSRVNSQSQVAFKGNEKQGRNVFPAISSALPGFGQMLNGEPVEGTVRLVGTAGLFAASAAFLAPVIRAFDSGLAIPKAKAAAGIAAAVGTFVLLVNNVVDAYRHKD